MLEVCKWLNQEVADGQGKIEGWWSFNLNFQNGLSSLRYVPDEGQ